MKEKYKFNPFVIIVFSILGGIFAAFFLNEEFSTDCRILCAFSSGVFLAPNIGFVAQKLTELTLKGLGDEDA